MKKLLLKGILFLSIFLLFFLYSANSTKSATVPELDDIYKSHFEKRKSAMHFIENVDANTNFLFYAKKFSKKDFLEKQNEYRTKGGTDSYIFDLITKQEEFYNNTIPSKTAEKVNAFIAELNAKKDYTKYSAKEALNAYKLSLEYIDGMLLLMPDNTEYIDLKTKNESGKKELEKYISSGDYEKSIATRTPAQINEIKLNEAKMQDIYAEWAATESILATIGNTSVIVITSKQWEIIRDANGSPIYKYVDAEASVRGTDGKCYKVTGTVNKTTDKEGNYSKPVFNYQYKEEMSCSSIK